MGGRVGILALQGAFAAHARTFADLGVDAALVRTPEDLGGLDALVLPGGESTTMWKLLGTSGLREPIAERIAGHLPVLGTCAGMILLASTVLDGRPDQGSFGAIDLAVRRNGYGRQVDSFEADLVVNGLDDGPVRAVFIRAPLVEVAGPDVEVLAVHDDHPVLCRSGAVTVSCFHPELSGDSRIHARFLEEI